MFYQYYTREIQLRRNTEHPTAWFIFINLNVNTYISCMPSADQALATDPMTAILMELTVQKRGAFIKEYSEKCKMTIAVSVLSRASSVYTRE